MKFLRLLMPLALLVVTACDNDIALPPEKPLNVSGPVYRFNVASIAVAKDYVSPRGPGNVEYLADVPPAKAIRQWVTTRLVAAGQMGSIEVDIKDASIVKKDIPKQKHGIEGFFTKEQTEQYDGAMDVEIKIYNGRKALPISRIEASAFQSHTLREDATYTDRQALYHQITVELMDQLNAELDRNIRQYFGKYLL